jgi:hypothetical protein
VPWCPGWALNQLSSAAASRSTQVCEARIERGIESVACMHLQLPHQSVANQQALECVGLVRHEAGSPGRLGHDRGFVRQTV